MAKKLIAPVILFCVSAFIISCISTVSPRREVQGGPEVQPVQSTPTVPLEAKYEAKVKEIFPGPSCERIYQGIAEPANFRDRRC